MKKSHLLFGTSLKGPERTKDMSENNKNGFEDLGKTISDLLTNVTKVVTESTEGLTSKLKVEKQKAEIRAEIWTSLT